MCSVAAHWLSSSPRAAACGASAGQQRQLRHLWQPLPGQQRGVQSGSCGAVGAAVSSSSRLCCAATCTGRALHANSVWSAGACCFRVCTRQVSCWVWQRLTTCGAHGVFYCRPMVLACTLCQGSRICQCCIKALKYCMLPGCCWPCKVVHAFCLAVDHSQSGTMQCTGVYSSSVVPRA